MRDALVIHWNYENLLNPLVRAQADGIRSSGWRVQERNLRFANHADSEPGAYLALICGWRSIRRRVGLGHMSRGTPVLVHDLGYINRFGAHYCSDEHHYQVSINGLCWLPPAESCDGVRFEKLPAKLKRWRRNHGDSILVLGQVPDDAQHDMTREQLLEWYTDRVQQMRAAGCTRRVVFRPHPRVPDMVLPCADEQQDPAVPLADAFRDAHAVLTINSTAGTEALLAAVPVVCSSTAMYAEYAETDPCSVDAPRTGDREEYFRRLSYAQWTAPECRSGECFAFLQPFIETARHELLQQLQRSA